VALDSSTLRTPGSDPSALRELASGIDALYLSGRASLSDRLIADLTELRAAAEEADEPQLLRLAGEDFRVEGRSFGKHRFWLSHPHGVVGVTPSETLPAFRVQPRSEFLHAVGPRRALEWFEGIGEYLAAGPVWWSLSRLDLFCDVQGWQVEGDDRRRFVTRARRRDLHEEGEALTGFEFGRRTTKTVCARIYDKTLQVATKGLDWWYAIWGEAFDPDRQVLRVEFEIGREGLKQFQIDTPSQGLDRAPGLWRSLTEDWLTYRIPSGDATRSRWDEAPEWLALQAASLASGAAGIERIRAGKRKGDLRTTMPQLVGYLARVAAILELPDLPSTLAAVRTLAADDEIRRGISFEQRISERTSGPGYL
jgi:hypothetical protein